MQGLFKFSRWMTSGDAISDCAKNIKDLSKLKLTYPPEQEEEHKMVINLKA